MDKNNDYLTQVLYKELGPGDWVFIPAHERRRVEWTSKETACIWLAVHGNLG